MKTTWMYKIIIFIMVVVLFIAVAQLGELDVKQLLFNTLSILKLFFYDAIRFISDLVESIVTIKG